MFDVITMGETMLRLTPPDGQRLIQADRLTVDVGGSESNVAVGLVRLGLSVSWISRLPRSPLGERVAHSLRGWGVDVSQVIWADDGRLGLYFWEDAVPPRSNLIVYDRQRSAMSLLTPEELPEVLSGRHLHLTGITPALAPQAAESAGRLLDLARSARMTISFDLNYRRNLWAPEAAAAACEPFLQAADLLLLPLRDAQDVLQVAPSLDSEKALAALAACYPDKTIVLTLGGSGAAAIDRAGRLYLQPAFSSAGNQRIGSGDAFAAGVIYGFYFAGAARSPQAALRWGAAMAALKRSIPGDMPLVDREAVVRLAAEIESDHGGDVR